MLITRHFPGQKYITCGLVVVPFGMNASYYIQAKKVNKKGRTTIMMDLAWQGSRLQLSSGVMCEPQNFTPEAKKVLHNREEGSLSKNFILAKLKLALEEGYLDLERRTGRTSTISVDAIRVLAKEFMGKPERVPVAVPSRDRETVWNLFARWQHLNRHKHSESHLRRFVPVKRWLDQYAPAFELSVLNEEWVQGYINWLFENSTLRNSSLRTHVAFFRTMLKINRMPYEWLDNPYTETTPGVDLHYDEMQRVYVTEYLHEDQRAAADVYVFLCQVGLRYGDFLKLDAVVPYQTPDGEVLVILDQRQGKTKAPVSVPLNEMATAIWNKYSGSLPKISNQEFNRRLKEVGRVAKLTRQVAHTTVRGKDYTTSHKPLWQLLTAHTARHTCACLLLEGSGGKELSQLTLGQSSRSSTNIYARPKMPQQVSDTLDAWKKTKSRA